MPNTARNNADHQRPPAVHPDEARRIKAAVKRRLRQRLADEDRKLGAILRKAQALMEQQDKVEELLRVYSQRVNEQAEMQNEDNRGQDRHTVESGQHDQHQEATQPPQFVADDWSQAMPTSGLQEQQEQTNEIPYDYSHTDNQQAAQGDVQWGQPWSQTDVEWAHWQTHDMAQQQSSDWANFGNGGQHVPAMQSLQQGTDDWSQNMSNTTVWSNMVVMRMYQQQSMSQSPYPSMQPQTETIPQRRSRPLRRDALPFVMGARPTEVPVQPDGGIAQTEEPEQQPRSTMQPQATVQQRSEEQVSVAAQISETADIVDRVSETFARQQSPDDARAPEETAAVEPWNKVRIWRVINIEPEDEALLPLVKRPEPFPADGGRAPPHEAVMMWLRNGDVVRQLGHSKKIRGHMVMPVKLEGEGDQPEGWVTRRRMDRLGEGPKVWFEEISQQRGSD